MSPKTQNAIALFCYSLVSRNFAMCCNPRYRGTNFNWSEFPDMMAEECKTMRFINVHVPKKQKAECDEHAFNTGREIAESMVNWMTKT